MSGTQVVRVDCGKDPGDCRECGLDLPDGPCVVIKNAKPVRPAWLFDEGRVKSALHCHDGPSVFIFELIGSDIDDHPVDPPFEPRMARLVPLAAHVVKFAASLFFKVAAKKNRCQTARTEREVSKGGVHTGFRFVLFHGDTKPEGDSVQVCAVRINRRTGYVGVSYPMAGFSLQRFMSWVRGDPVDHSKAGGINPCPTRSS